MSYLNKNHHHQENGINYSFFLPYFFFKRTVQYILNYFTACSQRVSMIDLFYYCLLQYLFPSFFWLPGTFSKPRLQTINTKSSGTEAWHTHSLLRLVTSRAQKSSSVSTRATSFLFKDSQRRQRQPCNYASTATVSAVPTAIPFHKSTPTSRLELWLYVCLFCFLCFYF